MKAHLNPAAAANRQFWAPCSNTHVARPAYYQRVRCVLPLLCELHVRPATGCWTWAAVTASTAH
jgi:hypothetical protein